MSVARGPRERHHEVSLATRPKTDVQTELWELAIVFVQPEFTATQNLGLCQNRREMGSQARISQRRGLVKQVHRTPSAEK